MKQIITAIAAAGLLLVTGPVLADDRHSYRGKQDSDITGSAFRKAYNRERNRNREDGRDRGGKHRPDHRGDRKHHKGRDRDHHKGRDKQHGRDRDHRGDRDRHHKRKHGYDKGYKRGYKQGYRKGHKHGHNWGHRRPHHKPHWPRYRPGYRHHKPRWRPAHYGYGYRWRHLPRNFVRISVGALGFYYSDGIFYRPHSHGYVVAQPPVGAIVHSLPGSAVTVVFGGLNYYVAYDTYYLWDGPISGYRVVANPGFY
ncbi:DUF6515 family protein [Microbulbifer taiwanensis]|uniref:DUF6515 family protein n=1 Tax=Microbulbifer taiwanensis TaxID=986746 RepID=A0ABW1YP89_9GAMM|nr:DUF6515 family protein [Microbulbifer taiwanensis]